MASTAITTIYDSYIFGGRDVDGSIKQVWGNDALSNAVLLWLSIYQGEILRNPSLGGVLTKLLMKPMSDERALDIQQSIQTGLLQEFTPVLTSAVVVATPDYANRKWNISLTAYSNQIKTSVNLNVTVKNLV